MSKVQGMLAMQEFQTLRRNEAIQKFGNVVAAGIRILAVGGLFFVIAQALCFVLSEVAGFTPPWSCRIYSPQPSLGIVSVARSSPF